LFVSKIRWKHEIECFKGLKSITFRDGIDFDSLGRGDVLVCDAFSLHRLGEWKSAGFFLTILVDCRCSTGFEGSRSQTTRLQKKLVPSETFLASSWWHTLLRIAANRVERRALIENFGESDLPAYAEGKHPKLTLEISAWRASFLLRTPIPAASKWTPARIFLSWARRRAIMDGKDGIGVCEAVQKVISASVQSLHFNLNAATELNSSLFALSDAVLWDVRLCPMPLEQAEAYSRCCAEVQSRLQCSLYSGRTEWEGASDAIMSLRRSCSHANLYEFMAGSVSWFDGCCYSSDDQWHRSTLSSSPSQSSQEVATRILSGSAKIQALLSILIDECGFERLADFRFQQVTGTTKQGESREEMPQRIAILVALPELQLMTSMLLNCVGVSHELLRRTSSHPSSQLWVEHQSVLSAFNADFSAGTVSTQIVVGSLETVAANLGGLSIEGADLVVCLDEDWSGCGEMLLYSVLARSLKKREMTGSYPCPFIRLVTANTCEQSFLKPTDARTSMARRTGAKSKALKAKLPMCLNPIGLFDVVTSLSIDQKSCARDSWRSRAPGTTYFVFPGSNIAALRGTKLVDVLGINTITSPFAASRKDPLFLPIEGAEDQVLDEIGFLSSLLEKERTTWRTCQTGIAFAEETNMFSSPIVMYLDRQTIVLCGKSAGSPLGLIQVPPASSATSISAHKALTSKVEGDHHSSFYVPPGVESATSSFLFYPLPTPNVASVPRQDLDCVSEARTNLYASSYGSLERAIEPADGNQGNEPLVYCPPLFPRILESSRLAKSDTALLMSRVTASQGRKRSAPDNTSSTPLAKRVREESVTTAVSEKLMFGFSETFENTGKSLPPDPLGDDFGLGGTGAVPLPRDSALAAAYAFVDTLVIPDGSDALLPSEWLSNGEACCAEEMSRARDGGPSLKSMILFVTRKRARGYSGRPNTNYNGGAISTPWASFASAVSQNPNNFVMGNSGPLTGKRPKKNTEKSVVGPSAFTRIPGIAPSPIPNAGHGTVALPPQKTQDMYRKFLLSSIRQSGMGLTLFEASSFRTAALQVQNRVGGRLIRHCWSSSSTFEVGPGIPLHIAKLQSTSPRNRLEFKVNSSLWTSIVKRPSSESSMAVSDAISSSSLQLSSFRASQISPCRVDFGPFQTGFLSMPSGMTSIAQPRARPGVSLPMGVKISSIPKDQSPVDWSAKNDAALQRSLIRFGMNWNLAAGSLRCFQEFRFVPLES
jgi:hypothetical protein